MRPPGRQVQESDKMVPLSASKSYEEKYCFKHTINNQIKWVHHMKIKKEKSQQSSNFIFDQYNEME